MLSQPHGAEPEEKPLLWSECGTKIEEGMASGSERLPGWGCVSSDVCVFSHTGNTEGM